MSRQQQYRAELSPKDGYCQMALYGHEDGILEVYHGATCHLYFSPHSIILPLSLGNRLSLPM